MGGAKRYLAWRQPPSQPAATPLVLAAIGRALESLNVSGQQAQRWQAKCSLHQHINATAASAKDVYLVSLGGDARAPGYIVLRAEKQVVEAEPAIFEIFDRTGLYQHRVSLSFEGVDFAVDDFVLRLARITGQNSGFLGIMLELEYLPVASYELARQALDEFTASVHRAVSSVPGGFLAVPEPSYAEYGLSAHEHTGRHSALALVRVISMAAAVARKDSAIAVAAVTGAPGPAA